MTNDLPKQPRPPTTVYTHYPKSTQKPMENTNSVEKFVSFFKALETGEQNELMQLVYEEHKVRNIVRTFSSMPTDQRRSVFQRLGLPQDLLSRIPPPVSMQEGEIEVEWQEWQGKKS